MSEKKLLGRAFVLLWMSETAFDLGSALLSFALGVWIYQQSGSVQMYSYSIVASAVPMLLFIPLGGVLADRYDRRWVIALCDTAAALMVLLLAVLLFSKQLVAEHMYAFAAVGAAIGALRNPSYHAAISQIVPPDRMTEANGLIGMSAGLLQIGAPMTAGYLMAHWGLEGIMAIEVVMTVAGAIGVFAALSSASHAIRGVVSQEKLSFGASVKSSFAGVRSYFKAHPLMLSLAAYMLVQEALLILCSSMLAPMVLAEHSEDTLGTVLTAGAVGGVIGSIVLVAAKVKKHLMLWILATDLGLALCVVAAGFSNSVMLWGPLVFLALALGGVSEGCGGALWMRKVPKEQRGSVFAAVGSANLVLLCVVMLLGGGLAELVLEPGMLPGGALAAHFEPWLGSGKGRGVALLFVVVGALFAVVSTMALLNPRLRRLDELVPEQTDPETPVVAGASAAAAPAADAATATPDGSLAVKGSQP